jgi:probable phosphoglycerate mutase
MNNLVSQYKKFKETPEYSYKIFLCRHGETVWNKIGKYQGWKNSPLSDLGKEQAEKVANCLKNQEISQIYSSPLGRAQQTSQIIKDEISLEKSIIHINAMKEVNFGDIEGHPKEEVHHEYSDFFKKRDKSKQSTFFIQYPNGESYLDAYLRVLKPILGITAKTRTNIALVAHQGINRLIIRN